MLSGSTTWCSKVQWKWWVGVNTQSLPGGWTCQGAHFFTDERPCPRWNNFHYSKLLWDESSIPCSSLQLSVPSLPGPHGDVLPHGLWNRDAYGLWPAWEAGTGEEGSAHLLSSMSTLCACCLVAIVEELVGPYLLQDPKCPALFGLCRFHYICLSTGQVNWV